MTDKYFVIDVNILVSAFLFAKSKPRQALDKIQNLGIILLSDAVLSELIEVLTRPKFDRYLSKQTREQLTDDLAQTALFIRPNEQITECRDAKDNKYLELAVEGSAQCVVTGDQDLLVLNPFREIAIITAQEFLTQF
ncbi:MAG: hypothetical protein RLZZ499_539 [Cyanobacteriota bacterium]